MKNIMLLSFCVALIFFSGCEQSFNPKTDLDEEYILTCLISCTHSYHTATISRTFDVEGFDPTIYDGDLSVGGADIRLWYQDTVYVFKDSTLADEDVTENNYRHFYYLDNFTPEYNQVLEIEATLPNGIKLYSTSVTPNILPRDIFSGQGDAILPPQFEGQMADEFIFYPTINGELVNSLYLPRLFVKYRKSENGVENNYLKEMPIDYVEDGGEYYPVYPPATNQIKTRFKTTAVDRAMREISGDDPNKGNYTITGAFVYLCLFDQNLSAYYGALQMISDGFTVRIDVPEFSNVENGYGVFGTYFEKYFPLVVLRYYPESFGYNYEFNYDNNNIP